MKQTKSSNHHIFICTGKDCKKKGSEELKSNLKKAIKEQQLKNVRFIKSKCMDYCQSGPNIMIDGELLHECHAEDVKSILAKLKEL